MTVLLYLPFTENGQFVLNWLDTRVRFTNMEYLYPNMDK